MGVVYDDPTANELVEVDVGYQIRDPLPDTEREDDCPAQMLRFKVEVVFAGGSGAEQMSSL